METQPIITEDYVPFYIAELLAEKGFDIPLKTAYNADKKAFETSELCNFNATKNQKSPDYSRPTVQMALKWIRAVYDICIYVYPINAHNAKLGKWEGGACWIEENVSVIFYTYSHSLYGDTYEKTLYNLIEYILKCVPKKKEYETND